VRFLFYLSARLISVTSAVTYFSLWLPMKFDSTTLDVILPEKCLLSQTLSGAESDRPSSKLLPSTPTATVFLLESSWVVFMFTRVVVVILTQWWCQL